MIWTRTSCFTRLIMAGVTVNIATPASGAPNAVYRGLFHLQENAPPPGPYRRHMPRVLGGSYGVGRFLMGEVPLYTLFCGVWR